MDFGTVKAKVRLNFGHGVKIPDAVRAKGSVMVGCRWVRW